MAYIGKSPSGTGVRQRYYFTATGGETSLSGTDDNGLTLSYTDGAYVDVLLNGIELVAGTDYNTSTANTIAGLAALAASDVVTVTVYDIFTVADTVSAKDGGTFSGNVVMNADLTVDTDTLYVDSTGGYVGIGVTSPARIVDISTTGSTPPRLTGTSSNGAYLDFHNNAATTGRFRVGQGYGSGTDNVGFLNNEANADMVFGTNNTQQMRIEADGDKIFYGDAGVRDAQITNKGQLVGGIGATTTSGTTDWNDVTNARSGSGYTLLAGNASNGPGGAYYYHPFSFEYNSKNGSGNLTQLAIGYNVNSRYMRFYYASSWSSWVSF
jgi:hypothetical protein